MLTMILSVYNLLKENSSIRTTAIVIAIIAAISFGGYWGYNKIYANGYDAGIVHQTEVFNNKQKEVKDYLDQKQKEADSERLALNSQISDLKKSNTKLQNELNKKQTNINKKVSDYEKSSEGISNCFKSDSSGLRIINESFPNSN